MLKTCVVLNGQIINIGEWDYQVQSVEVTPAQYDEEGDLIAEAVFEDVVNNPLPVGAVVEQRDFDFSDDRGWFEVGTNIQPTLKQQVDELKITLGDFILFGGV